MEDKTSSQAQCAEIWDLLFSKGSDIPISDYKQVGHLSDLWVLGLLETLLRLSVTAAEVRKSPPILMSVGLIWLAQFSAATP
jgi:hypothetical protein